MTKRNGFRVPRRTCRLILDGDFAGAEAEAQFDVGLGAFFDFAALEGSTNAEAVKEAMRQFGETILISWNFVDDAGDPLPADADGFLRLPLNIARALMAAWVEAVSEVPVPLDDGSPSGDSSLVEASEPLGES